MVDQIRELEAEIADALRTHPDGEIFSSFFRSPDSVICAATLLSEIGDCRARYPHRDAIAADAGQAPLAVESGKRKNASFRWACNKRLRNALGPSRTSPASGTRGQLTAMPTPALAAITTAARYAPWAARGAGSSGAAARPRPLRPQRHTGLQQHITVTIPTPSGPRPDITATQRMAGAAVTRRAAHRAERAALDGKPASAITAGG